MEQNTKTLKMSLQELRNSINLEKDIWINNYSTNCYAYALGLDIPDFEIGNYAYSPGVISNSNIFLPNNEIFTYEEFINNLYSDLKALEIQFKEINPLDKINIDEWKIAIFVTEHYNNYIEDYHFLREHKNGTWYHKNGYKGTITKYDDNNKIIKNPKECFLEYRKYKKCLSLKLIK